MAKKNTKDVDVSMLRKGDILIPIMGVTGVGKSTFINIVAGRQAAIIREELDSQPQPVLPVIIPYPGDNTRRIVFLDTPGFNDTWRSDTEILRRITIWLQHSCEAGVTLAGVIYLHEISQNRVQTTGGSLTMFDAIYQPDLQNVILATTKWKQPETDAERDREKQLTLYWKGPLMPRFMNTPESAWEVVRLILKKEPLNSVQFRETINTLLERLPKAKVNTWRALASQFGKLFA